MKYGWVKWVLAGVVLVLSSGVGIELWVDRGVRRFSDSATRRFGGDSTTALLRLVTCESCPMPERNHAVWALGHLREKRALPVLANYRTYRKCDHARELCQYEVEKAIKRMQD